MRIRYLDQIGVPVEVDAEQFRKDYCKGKVNPNQNVLANGASISVEKLLEIIEEAEDKAYVKAATKAKLEEEQFQKTAPWWLKRNIRIAITWGVFGAFFLALASPWLDYSDNRRYLYAAIVIAAWECYYHFAGAKRYNTFYDLLFMSEHDDIIQQHQNREKKP